MMSSTAAWMPVRAAPVTRCGPARSRIRFRCSDVTPSKDATVDRRQVAPAGGQGKQALRPMLAVGGELPSDDAPWAYEMKWDGIRALAHIDTGKVMLVSRTGRDVSASYPELQGLASAWRSGVP